VTVVLIAAAISITIFAAFLATVIYMHQKDPTPRPYEKHILSEEVWEREFENN